MSISVILRLERITPAYRAAAVSAELFGDQFGRSASVAYWDTKNTPESFASVDAALD